MSADKRQEKNNASPAKPNIQDGLDARHARENYDEAQPQAQHDEHRASRHGRGTWHPIHLLKIIQKFEAVKPIFPRGFVTCPPLTHELLLRAVGYVGTEIVNALSNIRLKRLVDARNRVDVPHGMFGFSLEDFYQRRQIKDTLYMDVLHMVQPDILQDVKKCIVLDGLLNFISRLFKALGTKEMDGMVQELRDAEYLLTIGDIMQEQYRKNCKELQDLRFHLNFVSQNYAREAFNKLDTKLNAVQNEGTDTKLVTGPIEYRYQLRVQTDMLSQYQLKDKLFENRFQGEVDLLNFYLKRENLTSSLVRDKLKYDIQLLKHKLNILGQQYYEDSERLDSDLVYQTNILDIMKRDIIDLKKKMAQHQEELIGLRAWEHEKKEKERAKLHAQLMKEERKRLKKEAKEAALAAKKAKRRY